MFYHISSVKFRDVIDGTSLTLMVGERKTGRTPGWRSTWVGRVANAREAAQRIVGSMDHTPNHPNAHFDDFSSSHEGGAHFVLSDGHVRFISENIDEGLYKALATINGRETIGEF